MRATRPHRVPYRDPDDAQLVHLPCTVGGNSAVAHLDASGRAVFVTVGRITIPALFTVRTAHRCFGWPTREVRALIKELESLAPMKTA